ncbi:hypothetical protein ACW5XW_20260 [Aeromonas piscicola]|uniref:Uncharacterized protein n=1 Tax=Aeromonas piscicola TaxID=600645 RepID=A0ABT7QHV8_9GAMM|nr:hypothetical protein [Aeromonas piscicola]MDM5133556.1 hypothetical protein [Aeromonas piscicola]
MIIHSFKSEQRKNMLLGGSFLLLLVLWCSILLFSLRLSRKTVIADTVPELLTYITISALFGLVGAIFTAFRCPGRDALKHITKAFGSCFFMIFITSWYGYDMYVYFYPDKVVSYDTEYKVVHPGPSKGKYGRCEAGLKIKDKHTGYWFNICYSENNLGKEQIRDYGEVWVKTRVNEAGSYLESYKVYPEKSYFSIPSPPTSLQQVNKGLISFPRPD